MPQRKPAPLPAPEPGPFRAHHVPLGSPYELSDGHPIRCMSSGQRHGAANARGAALLASDPAVDSAGIDVGVEFNEGRNLRAPDVSVGIEEERPGWAHTAPPLCVEFADRGQDEADLARKISELLAAGTRYVWVVRLAGPRRVEVHEQGRPMRVVPAGQELRAEGVLQNPVPVLAFFEKDMAYEVTLRNLLQRRGFASLESLWARAAAEGEAEGLEKGLQQGLQQGAEAMRAAIRGLCEVLAIPLDARRQARLRALDLAGLQALFAHLQATRRWPPTRRR